MKAVLFFLSILTTSSFIGQTSSDNLNKYWSYRDRIRKNFLKIGDLAGESIPMTARRVDWAFSGQDASPWPDASAIYYSDATIYLGHYIMVLATEYKLTNDLVLEGDLNDVNFNIVSQQKTQCLHELYYAIQALNRLDAKAETYLSEGSNTPSPDDKNGFLLRDDVPKNFYLNFLSEYSEIFDRECDFEFTDSDFYAFPEYPNDPNDNWPDIPLDQMQDIPNEEQRTFNPRNIMSLDQITTIFSGLRCVYDLVGDEIVQPTPNDPPLNLRLEAKNIVHRILDYIVHEETCPGNDPCFSFQIKNVNGRTNSVGSDLSVDAPFIFSIGRHFNYPRFNDWVNDGLMNIRVAFMMDSPELLALAEEMDWNTIINTAVLLPGQIQEMFDINPEDFDVPISINYPCIGPLIDRLIEKGNEPINIGTISLTQLMVLIDEIEQQNIQLISGNSEICVSLTSEIIQTIEDLDIDVQGMFCDNTIEALAKLIAGVIVTGLITGPGMLVKTAFMAWLAGIGEDPSFCVSTSGNNLTSEDNIHIIQELVTISERLGPNYIHSIAEPSGLDYYTMLRAVLDPSSNASTLLNYGHYRNDFINTAPCGGTWGLPETGGDFTNPEYCSQNEWASRNRLFHAQDRQFGANTPEFRGEYAGLDFMLYYNLYHLLWKDELPPYIRNLSCECVHEITSLDELNTTLDVNRKFPDYKAKGIPIESFLAHDLTVTTSTGVLNVRNDLIICRELPEVQTTLRIENGATVNLYEENTITVREGNRIVLTAGGQLLAGLDNDDGSYLAATIVLEENAELIVEDDAAIVCYQKA